MIRQKHLKALVRARMEKTGETYAAARRQIVTQVSSEAPSSQEQFPGHLPGSIPAATGLRVLLASAGVRAPHTQQPLTEAMVFGIAGGIGAGVFAFHYAKENFSSFYIAGRHLWQDDLAYARAFCARRGLATTVKESSGAKAAAAQLNEALESGPVLAWVDATHLPHRAMPASWSGGGYHVVVVYRIDAARGMALLGDLTDEPVEIPLAALAEARARIKSQKHRILTVAAGARGLDLETGIGDGLRAAVSGLAEAKKRSFSLEGFKDWADRLHGSTAKDSWDKTFPRGGLLWSGLLSIHDYIEHYGTGGGLMRPIYADQALPSDVPAFREAKALLASKVELRLSGSAPKEIGAVWTRLGEMAVEAAAHFPLSAADADGLRRDLKARPRAVRGRG